MGKLPDPEKPLAAVVGTRRPSGAAAAQAYSIGRDLASGGVSVVSGLALGIDAMAHRGNLEEGWRTIAVLGSGLDCIYPKSNRPLARRVLENGGLLLSEYPPGTEPFKWNFPTRNRIIAALARGTVVVEAPAKSGALITARLAIEQNRDIWVASSGAASPLGAGTARLVEDGAPVIASGRDILEEWGIDIIEEPEHVTSTVTSSAAVGASVGASLGKALGQSLQIGI
jgi:DNA processing protein